MTRIIKEESTFSFIEERDWFLGNLKLRENIIEEVEQTHYDNGFVRKSVYKYYIRTNRMGEVCSGQVSLHGILREISIQKCMDVMNSVDWSIY